MGGPPSSTTSNRRARRATCSWLRRCCSATARGHSRARSASAHRYWRNNVRSEGSAEAARPRPGARGPHPRRIALRAQGRPPSGHRGDPPAEGAAAPALRRGAHRGAGRIDPEQGRAPAPHRPARAGGVPPGRGRAPLARGAESRPARAAGDGARSEREGGIRAGADRKHPARGPEPRRGSGGLQAPHRGARPDPGRAGGARRQGSLHRRERAAPLAAARGHQAGHRRRPARHGSCARSVGAARRRPAQGGREGGGRRVVGARGGSAGAAAHVEAPAAAEARAAAQRAGPPPGGEAAAQAGRESRPPGFGRERHAGDPLPGPGRARPHPGRHPGGLTMATEANQSALDALEARRLAPARAPRPHRELTARAVAVAIVVAALLGAAEPVVGLRIGYGPNISVVSAFLGFIAISLLGLVTGVRGTRWEDNLVQTAGTAAGSGVGFMAVVLAAIDLLNARGLLNLHLSGPQIFAWLAPSGLLGVLLAVPLRKHYIDQENLTFADGTAAGETLLVLDEGPRQAGPRVAALGIGGAVSAPFTILRHSLALIPETLNFPLLTPHAAALRLRTPIGPLPPLA